LASVFAVLASLPVPEALLGVIGGDLSTVLPLHAPGGFGTYEAGVMALVATAARPDAAVLAAAVNLHLLVLGIALLAGAIAWLTQPDPVPKLELRPERSPNPMSASILSLSVVIPMYCEQDNVKPMLEGVHRGLADYPGPWELIVVDDGSTDETGLRLIAEAQNYGPHVRVLRFARNHGQTAAMQAGIDAARGDVLATLDGDLQNDPADIPRLVREMIEGDLDLLAGKRTNRQDALFSRKIPSKIANSIIGRVTGVRITDYGCSLKVYRASIIK
jgi:cellulose synthase/poly-beta-1,6-N-acetylglucosamine synthase-like glycosyltransferase